MEYPCSFLRTCSTIVVHCPLIYLNKISANVKKPPSFAVVFNKMRNFAVPYTSLTERCPFLSNNT